MLFSASSCLSGGAYVRAGMQVCTVDVFSEQQRGEDIPHPTKETFVFFRAWLVMGTSGSCSNALACCSRKAADLASLQGRDRARPFSAGQSKGEGEGGRGGKTSVSRICVLVPCIVPIILVSSAVLASKNAWGWLRGWVILYMGDTAPMHCHHSMHERV